MKKEFNHINLQLFAEDTGGNTNPQGVVENNDVDSTKKDDNKKDSEKKTYTDDDVTSLKEQWQKEKDKEYSTKLQEAIKNAIKEEKRLSKLSEEERKKEEQDNKLKDIEQREKALNFKEKLSDVKDELIKRKLPTTFASYLVDEDNAKSLEKINEFEKNFREAVQIEIDSRIKGISLKAGDNNATSFGKTMATKMNETKQNAMNPWAK